MQVFLNSSCASQPLLPGPLGPDAVLKEASKTRATLESQKRADDCGVPRYVSGGTQWCHGLRGPFSSPRSSITSQNRKHQTAQALALSCHQARWPGQEALAHFSLAGIKEPQLCP